MNLPSRYKPTGSYFEGGQGIVTIWNDISLGRDVAVKVLSSNGIGGSLLDEAALLGLIKSKHVVEIYEIGTDATTGRDYLIMEFVSGSELAGYAPENIRSLYLTLFQVVSGIEDIHEASCIHRDLKPNNIKYDGANIIKIIDFGIGARRNPVSTDSGRGTDGYRGPEYFKDVIQLTTATDIYAFGAIAYEFCFGALDPLLFDVPPSPPPSFTTASIGPSQSKIAPEIASILDLCFQAIPTSRPKALEIKRLLAKHLLRNQHVANFVHDGILYDVSHTSNQCTITASKGSFVVQYNGLDFILVSVTGEVFVNGIAAAIGMRLPGSCVIIIGAGSGPNRIFIPFNVSHPEVIL